MVSSETETWTGFTSEFRIYIGNLDEEREETLAAHGEPRLNDRTKNSRYETRATGAKPGDIPYQLTFRTVLLETTTKKRRSHKQFSASVPICKGLIQHERFRVTDAFKVVTVDKGKYFFEQGDVGNRFYVTKSDKAAAVEKDFIDENGNVDRRTVPLSSKLGSEPHALYQPQIRRRYFAPTSKGI
ncbi:hypothetical protein CALCODRAFT_513512, partial [Calocera cornea HHB12733]